MINNEFILEIGTEELPANFIDTALNQIRNIFVKLLENNNIKYNGIEVYIAPCRIIILVENLASKQDDVIKEIQGPPYAVFYNNGEITEAGKNYLKSKKVQLNNIKVKETNKGKYIFITEKKKGCESKLLLPDIIEQMIKSIPLPKSMRWDNSDNQFLRPIRRISILYQGKKLNFNFGNIHSSDFSFGHKFINNKKFKITSIHQFKEELRKRYVMIDSAERIEHIKNESKKILGNEYKIEDDEKLLKETSNMVEYPFVVLCEFEKEYLKIPAEIVCTSIKHHQKSFPIYKGNRLTNKFIVVVNNFPNEIIKKGNERVLKARLNDAKFFYEEDRKSGNLEKFNDSLNQLLFLNDTGTMLDKVERIKDISVQLAKMLYMDDQKIKNISRTAQLSKADLMTSVVYEFPELQGIAGRIYAELDNEDKDVSKGIEEHYKPKNIDDTIPKSYTGYIVSISDRIDSIVGCFIKGLNPTGSQDQYQVRRNSLAIVNIILKHKLHFSIEKLVRISFDNYSKQNLVDNKEKEKIISEIILFLKNRIKTIFSEKGIATDEIDAILSAQFYDIYDSFLRVSELHRYRKNKEFKLLLIALKRMANILKGINTVNKFEPQLLIEQEEKELYNHHNKNIEVLNKYLEEKNYGAYYSVLSGYKKIVDNFFDKVLVMAEDEKIRNNRLSLLNMIVTDFKQIIDFSKISESVKQNYS